jgi:dolichol kinase
MDGIGRKFYHILGGVGLLSLYYLLGRDRALLCYGALFVFVLLFEVVRLTVPAVNVFVFTRFGSFVRKKERNRPTGTAWYVLGVGLSFMLYRPEFAAAAVCFLAIGDVMAATVGQRYGRTRFGDKSLEGTAAFFAACLLAGLALALLGMSPAWPVMIAGAVVAAVVELMPLPLNDNFAIPVISGGVMAWLARLIA